LICRRNTDEKKGPAMTTGADLSKCLAFIGCQIHPPGTAGHHGHGRAHPALTIARQTGCGAMNIAQRVAEFLQVHDPAPCHWTVFSRNLVAKMLEEHNLPEELARFIPEAHISQARDVVEELLGLHPPSETLVRQISETVVHLAGLGHVILVGRAANIITQHMKNVFHVRLVAPLENRVDQVVSNSNLTRQAALDFIHREDAARKRYLREFFNKDPDDALLYDLVVNTARFSPEGAAKLIGATVLDWVKSIAA
jgi:cytidylate kinase